MTTLSIPLSTISVQEAHSSTKYGVTATAPISAATGAGAQILARAALTQIPADAVVTNAEVRFTNQKAWSGSRTVTASRNTVAGVSSARTWATKPTTTATNAGSQTQTSAAAGALWVLPLTTIVQGWVSGTFDNFGMTISTTSTTAGSLRGSKASSGVPVLVVTYTTASTVPSGLHPTGVVSVNKPTLMATVAADTTSIQVQVDPAANGTTPGFDSGEVVTGAGLLDLSTTSYAGLSTGSSTQHRWRAKNAQGWSAWSPWATFSRTSWGTLTITAPTSTSEDDSPTITGTYSGTVTSWRAFTYDSAGKLLEDSGWTPGNAMAWGSTKSVGASGTAYLQIRDNVTREATPGDPDYKQASQAFTVTPSGTPGVITGLAVSQTAPKPAVHLSGSRSAIPDYVDIRRNGVRVARVAGADVFTGSGPYTFNYDDLTVPMNAQASYTVTAIVNGAFSNPSSAVTITPTCGGVWLYDTVDGSEVVLWGDGEADQSQPELAVLHTPISGPGGAPEVVRRRLGRYPRQGSLPADSVLIDVNFGSTTLLASASEANLRAWAAQDAGHLYRLVMGNQNDQVILGDITFGEVSLNRNGQRVLTVAANWWLRTSG